jgi:hypothetical protein
MIEIIAAVSRTMLALYSRLICVHFAAHRGKSLVGVARDGEDGGAGGGCEADIKEAVDGT